MSVRAARKLLQESRFWNGCGEVQIVLSIDIKQRLYNHARVEILRCAQNDKGYQNDRVLMKKKRRFPVGAGHEWWKGYL